MATARDYLLAIDQGTTSTRAILFDAAGQVHHTARIELTQHYPQPGWVEHDPEEIWAGVVATSREAIAAAKGPIAAIGITNQRETAVLWDRASGRAVHNAIVWQDRRTAPLCEEWRAAGFGNAVAQRTGLVVDPYFSASKIRWMLDKVPGLRERAAKGEIAFGTIDSFLLWRLTGGRLHATDATNASRSLLFDIHRQAWDEGLLALFGIPRPLLPEVRDNAADYGATEAGIFERPLPILALIGDQQAAAVGQACFEPGMIKSTYGTGCFVLVNSGAEAPLSRNRLVTTVGARIAGRTTYALEGSIFIAGAAVQWLRDRLGFVAQSSESEAIAAGLPGNAGVYLVPAFTGLGAPYWEPEARGALFGLTRDIGRAEIVRATLEAVCYQTRDL